MLLIIAAGSGWKIARTWRARTSEEKWRPQELQHARLAFAEKTFKKWWPIRLIARVDRGYWLNRELHLAEFKTRARAVAYSSDVIELSAERLAIEKSTGDRVSVIGYVLVQNPLGKRRSVHILGRDCCLVGFPDRLDNLLLTIVLNTVPAIHPGGGSTPET